MGKILGIAIQNYGLLKNVRMGQLYTDRSGSPLGNLVTIIGPSGSGKSTLADAFGFISDCLETDVEAACDANNRGGYEQLISQGTKKPLHFEFYYCETSNSRPITYELTIGLDKTNRPCVKEERLRQRVKSNGRPLSFLYLINGKGFAYEGSEGGEDDSGKTVSGKKVDVALNETRKLGIVTLGAMQQYSRIEKFLSFLRSWYLCYFTPDTARQVQTAAPTPYLNRTGSNLNNVAQYMYRDDPAGFHAILQDIQTKLPNIEKIVPVKMPNGQMVLEFWQTGFNVPFFSPKMSDGTLKLFAYYLLLHERNPRQLVFIEEPENGLYHQYMPELGAEMLHNVGTGFKKQLFITTHSPFFANALTPKDVWVLEKDDSGFSMLKCASDYALVKEMVSEDVLLGDLWYSRYFG